MFDWDQANQRKVEDHRLTPAQVEDAFTDPYRLVVPVGIVNGEERYIFLGATVDDVVIKAVYTFRGNAIRVVTAFRKSSGWEFRAYRSQQR